MSLDRDDDVEKNVNGVLNPQENVALSINRAAKSTVSTSAPSREPNQHLDSDDEGSEFYEDSEDDFRENAKLISNHGKEDLDEGDMSDAGNEEENSSPGCTKSKAFFWMLVLTFVIATISIPESRDILLSTTNEMLSFLTGDSSESEVSATTKGSHDSSAYPIAKTNLPYLQETRPVLSKGAWTTATYGNQTFKERTNTCYFKHVVRRITSSSHDPHLDCFSACKNINLQNPKSQISLSCIGWTMFKSSKCVDQEDTQPCLQSSQHLATCLLHHRLEEDAAYESDMCIAGRLDGGDVHQSMPTGEVSGSPGNSTVAKTNATKPANSTPGKIDAPSEKTSGNTPENTELSEQTPKSDSNASNQPTKNTDASDSLACPARDAILGNQKRPLRVFVACLQASGCTLLPYLLAQQDKTLAILDLDMQIDLPSESFYSDAEASYPSVSTIVLRQSIKGIQSENPTQWLQHVRSTFKPDVVLLFVRDPIDMYLHLANHIGSKFANRIPNSKQAANCSFLDEDDQDESDGLLCGTPESKLKAINQLYLERNSLDINAVISYEDICQDREGLQETLSSVGVCIPKANLAEPKRSIVDVMRLSLQYFQNTTSLSWGPGNLRNTFHTLTGGRESEERAFRLCQSELSTNVRIKLLAYSIPPYSHLTLSDVEEIVDLNAPDLVSAYEADDMYD